MELITNSRLSCFRRCPRAHRLRFVDLLTPVIDIAPKRDWGTVIHRALEYYWSHLSTDVNILADYGALIITDSDLDPFARSAALACWNGYIARWHATDCAAYRTLAVEAEFRTPLVNPDTGEASAMTLAGKMDGIVQDHDGKVYGCEHKTSGSDITPGSAYWQRLRIDSQISVYHDGAASLGHNLAGMIYDVIKRPTQKPYKATPVEDRKITKEGRLYKGQREHDEEPVEYALRIALAISAEPTAWFQRATVVRIGDEMLEARRDTWRQAQALALDYRNPDACFKFADPCEYFALCSGSAGEGDYVVGNKHPELTTV